jgi:LysR family transcriptional regulator (chromosome initiation inhibitor)
LESGDLVNLAPAHALPVDLYWHCWNLDSQVIDRLTAALVGAAEQALAKNTTES